MADAVCDLFAARFRTQDGGPQVIPMRHGTRALVRLHDGSIRKTSRLPRHELPLARDPSINGKVSNREGEYLSPRFYLHVRSANDHCACGAQKSHRAFAGRYATVAELATGQSA